MTFKRIIKASVALGMAAILVIAACGCEDLGAYENTQEYYDSFGRVVLINGADGGKEEYSVSESFYNKESRENFMAGDDSAYTKKVEYGEYVYMAIPVQSNINMDTLALFLRSQNDVTVHINVFVINAAEWGSILEKERITEESEEEIVYDDLDPDARIGAVTVHLKQEKWGSFVLDTFTVNHQAQKSIQIETGRYILLQITNNSGLGLPRSNITMTNLLIRALDVKNGDGAQGGN